jgi:hypothetical protein
MSRYVTSITKHQGQNSLQWFSPCILPKTLKNPYCRYYFNSSNVYEIRGCTKRNIMVMLLSFREESKAARFTGMEEARKQCRYYDWELHVKRQRRRWKENVKRYSDQI